MISLDRPAAGKAQAQFDLEGKKQLSIKVDGQWKSLGALGPLGSILAMGGYFQQGLNNGGIGGAMWTGAAGLLKTTLEQPYFTGVKNVVQAGTSPQQYATNFAKSFVSSFVPTVA